MSPYKGVPPKRWTAVTRTLIDKHPLKSPDIVDVVLSSWNSIFASRMGTRSFHIGKDFLPQPQIMGFFLHELIPLELAARYPKHWRGARSSADKDIVYIPDDKFSIEVKTSSNPNHIFGNRSYAQTTTTGKKVKMGYYLAINFQKFTPTIRKPCILLIRFGWIDSTDWIGQKSETGQQSRLAPEVERYKLLEIYKHSEK